MTLFIREIIILPLSAAEVFPCGSLYEKNHKKSKNKGYLFGNQTNNPYFCINEKRHSGYLTPYGKKKEKMREHYTDLQ
jgi:hypothetical protein